MVLRMNSSESSSDPSETERGTDETARPQQGISDTPLNVFLPDQIGKVKQLGNYQLKRLVGRGGIGNVFEAFDTNLQRTVAVKVPRLDVLGALEFRERFLREARTTAQFDHPNLTSIIEVGSSGPLLYIVSQWCNGGDLATWLRSHPMRLDPVEIARFVAKVSEAIHYCHQRGIVHLDLKPSNVLLQTDGGVDAAHGSLTAFQPKVADFGLARWIDGQLDQTSTSMFLGTPLYMAPEQAECRRDQIGAATDVFSLGVLLHELVTGTRPFDAPTAVRVMDRVRSVDWKRSDLPADVPRDMAVVIERCLQREPNDRYRSAGELAEDLRRFSDGNRIAAKPPSPTQQALRWCRQPERMVQAGIVTVAAQITILINVYGHFALWLAGYSMPFEVDHGLFFRETFPVTALLHLPLLANGFRTIRSRPYSVFIGTVMSIAFLAMVLLVLASGKPAFSVYIGNPLATYVVHLTIGAIALVQLMAHLVAIPAALQRRLRAADMPMRGGA